MRKKRGFPAHSRVSSEALPEARMEVSEEFPRFSLPNSRRKKQGATGITTVAQRACRQLGGEGGGRGSPPGPQRAT
jgi:hypothetical protein